MKRLGIQQKMLIILLICFIPIALVCLWLQMRYYELVRENTSDYAMQLVNKVSYDLEMGLRELDSTLMPLLYDTNTAMVLANPEYSDASRTVVNRLISEAETKLGMNTMSDCNIVLLSNSRKIIASSYPDWTGINRNLSPEWENKIINADGGRVIVSAYTIYRSPGEENWSSRVVAVAHTVNYNGQRKGMLLLEIPTDYFYTLCSGLQYGNSGYLMLVDDDDYVIYCTEAEKIGSRLTNVSSFDNGNNIIQTDTEFMFSIPMEEDSDGIRTIAVVSRSSVEKEIDRMSNQMVAVFVAVGAGLVIIFALLARSFCKPVIDVCDAMRKLESGCFDVRVPQTSSDEVGDLQRGFNHMAKQLGVYVEEQYVSQVKAREAQLNDLVRMMDPHFMYNTLEAISMTAYINGDDKCVKMLEHLADMYRFSSGRSERTSLGEEIKNVEDYIYLINIRTDEGIELMKEVDEDLLNVRCIKFLLQPIVENCVVHGFSGRGMHGRIWIKIKKLDQTVFHITVNDDGCGMSEEKLSEIRRIIEDDKIDMENYPTMAVKNIHDRLRLSFGKPYGINVSLNEYGGTSVELMCPLTGKEETADDNSFNS